MRYLQKQPLRRERLFWSQCNIETAAWVKKPTEQNYNRRQVRQTTVNESNHPSAHISNQKRHVFSLELHLTERRPPGSVTPTSSRGCLAANLGDNYQPKQIS